MNGKKWARSRRRLAETSIDLRGGVAAGLWFAAFFSIVAGARLLMAALNRGEAGGAVRVWALASGFYVVAALAGGALYGLLRPIQGRYVGKVITAYVLLLLVYGGAFVTVAWLIEPEVAAELPSMLKLLVVLCIPLAPLYVHLTTRSQRRVK
jgi:hypothetical protein